MFYHQQSEDYRPLFWMGRRPVYANTLLLVAHVAAFVVTALCMSFFGTGTVEDALSLDTYAVLHYGEVWRLFSYIIFLPSLMFIFALGFLYFSGREVEQFVGRSTYLKLYAALVLIPAFILCAVGFVWPQNYMSGWESIFGVFIAFATIYPGVSLNIWFVNLTSKGWALALLAVCSLVDVAYHNWPGLLVLWVCAGVGYGGMRLIGAGNGFVWLTNLLENRRTEKLIRQRNFKILKDAKETESIDAVLEKISKQGVNSLTARERSVLEEARANLLKRDQH